MAPFFGYLDQKIHDPSVKIKNLTFIYGLQDQSKTCIEKELLDKSEK